MLSTGNGTTLQIVGQAMAKESSDTSGVADVAGAAVTLVPAGDAEVAPAVVVPTGGATVGFTEASQSVAVDPAAAALTEAVRSAFAHVFFYATVISALTALGSLGLREIPLRTA